MKKITTSAAARGKIRFSLIVIGFLVVVVFVVISLFRKYPSTVTIPGGDATGTISDDATPTPTSAPSTTQSTPIRPSVDVGHAMGISAGGGLGKTSTANINQELDQMVALGVKWVRFDIEWGNVQYSSPDTSTWTAYDTMVDALAAHHLKGLGIILFTPEWARDPRCAGGAKCPPRDPGQFATFAAEVALRYKGKVDAWEVWNEPNNYGFWATKTNCDAYTELLKATYPAIKQANPNAIVISGGLAPETTDANNISQLDFLNCMYRDGGKNYFDALGSHSYTFPKLPSANSANIWGQMSLTSPSLRSIMIANGDANKKIWITEFGTPTNGPDSRWFVTEQGQSQMVVDALQLYKTYDWAGPLFWYTLRDAGTTTNTIENFFGLEHADGTPKPAYYTLQNMISLGL